MKLPPYAKPLAALLRSGKRPADEVRIYVGGNAAWSAAKEAQPGRFVMVLPTVKDDLNPHDAPKIDDPSQYRWPVRDLDVIAYAHCPISGAEGIRLRDCLLRAGAALVIVISHKDTLLACDRAAEVA